VSVHWGTEYQSIHNRFQENIAHKLIDCWAEIIIWHHPHVIQDIWWYKNKPIIYSLWNFLFDQWFSEDTKKWMEVLIDYNINWNIDIFTWEINSFME
jgi:poly-gamma-glutamate synthesis protein (capsule biosynthesis protein)